MKRKLPKVQITLKDGTKIQPTADESDEKIFLKFVYNCMKQEEEALQVPPPKVKKSVFVKRWKKIYEGAEEFVDDTDWGNLFRSVLYSASIVCGIMIAMAEDRKHSTSKPMTAPITNSTAVRVLTASERNELLKNSILKEVQGKDGIYDFSFSPIAKLLEEAGYKTDCVKVETKKYHTQGIPDETKLYLNSTNDWTPDTCYKG